MDGIPASDRRYYPLYAKAAELDIPVRMYSSMNYATDRPYDLGHPRHLDQVAIDFPELTIIGGLGGWPWVNEMVALVRRHPKLHLDTSAHRAKYLGQPGSGWEMLMQFGNTLIQDKVLVGLSAGLVGPAARDADPGIPGACRSRTPSRRSGSTGTPRACSGSSELRATQSRKDHVIVMRRAATTAVFLLLVACGVAPAVRAGPLPLTEDHQRRLAAGEIIVVDTMPPGATQFAQGGTAVALVRAPVEKVWSILIDYPGHPRFYPRVVGVEVLKVNDGHALVRYVVGIGPMSFSFHMDKHQDAARRRIEWTLAEVSPTASSGRTPATGRWSDATGRASSRTRSPFARSCLPFSRGPPSGTASSRRSPACVAWPRRATAPSRDGDAVASTPRPLTAGTEQDESARHRRQDHARQQRRARAAPIAHDADE